MSLRFPPPPTRDDFDIAILCAKELESDAVVAMFDCQWQSSAYGKMPGDRNEYELGRIGNHDVALGYLPGQGTAISASAASSFLSSFPKIRLSLVVGICGGVPMIEGRNGNRTEVLLGDVIISTRVMEYRHGTQQPYSFIPKDTLQEAPPGIRSFLHRMKSIVNHETLEKRTSLYVSKVQKKESYKSWKYLGADRDRLYSPLYRHKHHRKEDLCETCNNCNSDKDRVCEAAGKMSCETLGCSEVLYRDRLVGVPESSASMLTPMAEKSAQTRDPKLRVHFGAVASGDLVMKSGHHRDEIVTRYGSGEQKIIAFEMEGAGVWGALPTLVIKGVSDYSDSHKRDEWQQFAAARAAACAKGIVEEFSREDTPSLDPIHYAPSDKIDRAEALIKKRVKESMKKDLEGARKLLKQVLHQSETLSSHSLYRVYWGLMIAEKELSCYTSFNDEDKMSHIDKARKWNSKLVAQNLDTGPRIHVDLERYIIQGRKALLELEVKPDFVEASRSKDDAIKGIDRMLEELKGKDHIKYDEVVKNAQKWRRRFSRT